MPGAAPAPQPSPAVRQTLKDLLSASEAFQALPAVTRREIAHHLARIAHTARALADAAGGRDCEGPAPLALAQNAGGAFSGAAVDRVADTTRQVLGAISFPRFVSELITGVFKAIHDSNQQQLHSFVELIRGVAQATGDFADGQVPLTAARQWLVDRFPANFELRGDDPPDEEELRAMDAEERREALAERDRATRIVLKPGADFPSEGMLRAGLSLRPDEPLPGRNPEELVSFARQAIARNRQQLLATMVMMGLQRIVVESGRLSASMNFHIDARSAAAEDRASSFDLRNETSVGGGASFGPWGASASVRNTIGYVTTGSASTTEEMNASANLGSSVELLFRSDYVPLTRLAGVEDIERIRVNSLNPQAEFGDRAAADRDRLAGQRLAEDGRRRELREQLAAPRAPLPQPAPPPPRPAERPPPPGGGAAPAERPSQG